MQKVILYKLTEMAELTVDSGAGVEGSLDQAINLAKTQPDLLDWKPAPKPFLAVSQNETIKS